MFLFMPILTCVDFKHHLTLADDSHALYYYNRVRTVTSDYLLSSLCNTFIIMNDRCISECINTILL